MEFYLSDETIQRSKFKFLKVKNKMYLFGAYDIHIVDLGTN